MRRRSIDPGFFTNEELARAELQTGLPLRVAFAGLWCYSDRSGRFQWKPSRIKLALFPYDPVDPVAVLNALCELGMVQQYEVEGKLYGCVPNFAEYQRLHPREAASRLPAPPAKMAPRQNLGMSKVSPRREKVTGISGPSECRDLRNVGTFGKKVKVRSPGGDADASGEVEADFAVAWAAYPKRPNNSRAKAYRAYVAARRGRKGERGRPASPPATADELLAGVRAYAAYCERESVRPEFIKLAATFFGPDEHWRSDYGPVERAEDADWPPEVKACRNPDGTYSPYDEHGRPNALFHWLNRRAG